MWRVVEGEALVLDPATGDYYSLNAVGTEILKGVTEGLPPEVIAQKVRTQFPDAPEDYVEQITKFCSELERECLDRLKPEKWDDELNEDFSYESPVLRKYNQLHQIAAYSPDEV